MTLKTASSDTILEDVSANKPAQNKSILVKVLLILLVLAIFGALIFTVIFNLLSPKNPYKTDAFLVTVNGDGTPFSALEEDTDGDKKIWVPRSKNGVLVGIRNNKSDQEKLNFALVFGTESTIEINSKTTARTLIALHPAIENSAKFYAENKDFGEIEIPAKFEDGYDNAWREENMQNALQKLLENKSIFVERKEEFKKLEVDNFPEKKFDYPEQIISLKNLEFDKNAEWFAANFAVDKNGLVAQNFSDMKMKIIVVSAKNEIKTQEDLLKNTTQFNLDPKQTIRIDSQKPWENGEYNVVLTPDVEFYTAQSYNKLLKHARGVEYEMSQDFMRDCFLNKIERKKCELPGIIDEILQQKPAENNQLVSKFVPLFVGEEVFLNSISNLPKNTDFTKLTPVVQQQNFKGVKATLKISPAKQTYKNDEFNISFEYPGDWELEKSQETKKANAYNNYEVFNATFTKENGMVKISSSTLPTATGFYPRYCTTQAEFTPIGEKFYRIDGYSETNPRSVEVVPAANKFVYLFAADVDLTKAKNTKPSLWEENDPNPNKLCVMSLTSSFGMVKTIIPSREFPAGQLAIFNIAYEWEGELDKRNLAEAEKIIDSLKYIKYR